MPTLGSQASSHPRGNSSPTQSANVWGFVYLLKDILKIYFNYNIKI